jgi:CRISPR-associated protein Csm4
MNTYRIIINPISPFATPLHSDTIFGQCMWLLKFMKGNEFLNTFINDIKENKKYFVISSGFISDEILLPMIPMHLAEEEKIKTEFIKRLTNDEKIKKDFLFYLFKKKNKQKKLKIKELFDNLEQSIDYFYGLKEDKKEDKIDNFLDMIRKNEKRKDKSILKEESVMRNRINRLSNRVDEGALFTSSYTFYVKDVDISIYIKTNCFTIDEVKELFTNLGNYGFGADSSIGKGLFIVKKIKDITNEINKISNPNFILSLSNYIPNDDEIDMEQSFYSVFLKQGKLGGEYATGIGSNVRSYVKIPLLMIRDSSLLKIKKEKEIYGKIEAEINRYDKNIIQSGQTFDIKLLIKEV